MFSGFRLYTLVNCLEIADSKDEILHQIQRNNTVRQEIPVRAIPERNPQKSKSPALLFQTIFYKGIMPSEKVLDLPVDCNTLAGSVNL